MLRTMPGVVAMKIPRVLKTMFPNWLNIVLGGIAFAVIISFVMAASHAATDKHTLHNNARHLPRH